VKTLEIEPARYTVSGVAGTLSRGRAALWTKDKIDLLSTPEVRNLHANAERLLETEIAALCLEVLGTRPRSGVAAPAKPPALAGQTLLVIGGSAGIGLETARLARAEGVPVAPDTIDRISAYVDGIPGSMRSSLLIDLSVGKRIEVEALLGSVVRRAAKAGVPAPIISTLYAVLKPYAAGVPRPD